MVVLITANRLTGFIEYWLKVIFVTIHWSPFIDYKPETQLVMLLFVVS